MPDDEPFLFDLYSTTRDYEMNLVPWDTAQKHAFLRQQCAAQLQHYRAHYRDATFDVILVNDVRAGRLYVRRTANQICIIDISLLPQFRGSGIGTELTQRLLTEAAANRKKVTLHVEIMNPARRLYERLGFRVAEDKGIYLYMEWELQQIG